MKSPKSKDSGVVSDGEDRLAAGIANSVRVGIQKDVEAQYAQRLEEAGTIRRWWISKKIKRELDRKVEEVVGKNFPSGDTLYLTK